MEPLKIEKDCTTCGHGVMLPDGKCKCGCHQFVAKLTNELYKGDFEKMKAGLNKEIEKLRTDPQRALLFRLYALARHLQEMEKDRWENASAGWTVEK